MAKDHTHKYQLKNLGTKDKPRKVYACALPDCSHYMPSTALVIDKASICNQCGAEFILTRDIISHKTVKPRCLKCRGKVKETDKGLDRALEMLLELKG